MTYRLSEILEEGLSSKNPVDYKRELLSIYQQLVPGKDDSTRMGSYHEHRETFRKEPRLTNSLSRLLIDAGMITEADKTMEHFFGRGKRIQMRTELSEHERENLVKYINSSLFGERFFNNRYGISSESIGSMRKQPKSLKRKNRKTYSENPICVEKSFLRRYAIEPERAEITDEPLDDFVDDQTHNIPDPIFPTEFNERYRIYSAV